MLTRKNIAGAAGAVVCLLIGVAIGISPNATQAVSIGAVGIASICAVISAGLGGLLGD